MSDNFSKTPTGNGGIHMDTNAATVDLRDPESTEGNALFESLSALMDDHADELELRRILKAIPANAELEAKWERFHTVRSCLQQEMHSRPAVNLLGGINARLAAESIPLPTYTTSRFANPMLRYIGQGAIAASFFAMTIIATSMFNDSGSVSQSSVADAGTNLETPVLGGEYKGTELTRTASLESTLDEEALARLRQAVHQEFSDAETTSEIPVSYTFELPVSSTPTP